MRALEVNILEYFYLNLRVFLGSFDWSFNYKRLPITKDDEKNPTRPFNSPVMAGGYFAISTKWFWELGKFLKLEL